MEELLELSRAIKREREVNYPKTLILDTKQLFIDYENQLQGLVNPEDIPEITTQIICRLLNSSSSIDSFDDGIDYKRLRSTEFLNSPEGKDIVDSVTNQLETNLRNLLNNLGAFRNNELPYFFSHFLGKDMVLSHLPY